MSEEFDQEAAVVALFDAWHDAELDLGLKRREVGPNADALTALTRGRGPRRGNLEDLLKYWRPIMKKPGGFRRCVVILMDKPQFGGRPQRICAWLHHELTGKWPNEGNHHGRRGKRPKKRSVRRRLRRSRGKKNFDNGSITVSAWSIAKRESREKGGLLTQPIQGRPGAVDWKASAYLNYATLSVIDGEEKVGLITSRGRTGRAVQSVASTVIPGDLGDIRHPVRSTIFETLTPGPPGRRGRRPGLPGRGRQDRSRNKHRCPPGFEAGGTFTNSAFSTCGRQILAIPKGGGPGALSPAAERRIQELGNDSQLIRSIGDLRQNRNPFDIIRAAQIPAAPKEVATDRRQASVDLILNAFDEQPGATFTRTVRRDGVILEPVVSLATLNSLGEFDDLNDGVLVVNDNARTRGEQIGQNEIPSLVTGLRAVVFHVPGQGSMSVRRVGGDLSEEERAGLNRSFAAALRGVPDNRSSDPTFAIRKFVDDSNGRYALDQNVGQGPETTEADAETGPIDRELITVERENQKITVPQWVFSTYLSRTAPRRDPDEKPWSEVVSEGSKTLQIFAIKSQRKAEPDLSEVSVPYFTTVAARAESFQMLTEDNYKVRALRRALRAIPGGSTIGRMTPGGGTGAMRAVFDPKIERYRCPAGTAGGGRLSDKFGRNCGARLDADTIERLAAAGRRLGVLDLDDPDSELRNIGINRAAADPTDWARFDRALQERGVNFDQLVENLSEAAAAVRSAVRNAEKGSGSSGRIGPSLREQSQRVDLTDEEQAALSGRELGRSLNQLAEVVDDPSWQELAPQEAERVVLALLNRAATSEAGRFGVNPARTREQMKQRTSNRFELSRILDKIAVDSPRTPETSQRGEERGGRFRNLGNRFANFIDDPIDPDQRGREDIGAPDAQANRPGRGGIRGALGRAAERIAGNRTRRDAVPVPELANLDDRQKVRVTRAMDEKAQDLDDFWFSRVADPDFLITDINDWINAQDGATPRQRFVWERRRDDWAELNDALRQDEIDFEDVVGRLSPAAREEIIRTADLNLSERRDRERRARLQREQEAEAQELARQVARAERGGRGRGRREGRRILGRDSANEQGPKPPDPVVAWKDGYNGGSLAPRPDHGFGFTDPVPVGNAGIGNANAAADHLRNGGDLADVPDEFLGEAIMQNASRTNERARFRIAGDGGGINGMIQLFDSKSESWIGIKFSDADGRAGLSAGFNEAHYEIVGAHLAERLGMPQGQMRFDGGPGTGRRQWAENPTPILVVDMGQNYLPPLPNSVDNTVELEKARTNPQGFSDIVVDDAIRLSILDFIQQNIDRHESNFAFYPDPDDPTKNRILIYDNGLSGQAGGLNADDGFNNLPIDDQMQRWREGKANLNQVLFNLQSMKLGDKDSVLASIVKMQATMAQADQVLTLDAAMARIDSNTEHIPSSGAEGYFKSVAAMRDRYDAIASLPAEDVYEMLLGVGF